VLFCQRVDLLFAQAFAVLLEEAGDLIFGESIELLRKIVLLEQSLSRIRHLSSPCFDVLALSPCGAGSSTSTCEQPNVRAALACLPLQQACAYFTVGAYRNSLNKNRTAFGCSPVWFLV
jgi:hypothetical protein